MAGPAEGADSVSTKISCVPPSSRAEGVTMVFGPMKIFSRRDIAERTSLSLTNSETLTGGAAAASAADDREADPGLDAAATGASAEGRGETVAARAPGPEAG